MYVGTVRFVGDGGGGKAVTGLRRLVWRLRVRFARVLASLVVVATFAVGSWVGDDTEAFARSQPPREVPVAEVNRGPRGLVDVYVLVDGRKRELFDGDSIPGGARVGQLVRVAVDPDDPSYVVAVDGRGTWEYTPLGNAALIVGSLSLVWGVGFLGRQPRGLIRDLRRPDLVPAAVVSREPASDYTEHVVVQVGEHRLRWTGDARSAKFSAGTPVQLAGVPRSGGWAALLVGPEFFLPEAHPLAAVEAAT